MLSNNQFYVPFIYPFPRFLMQFFLLSFVLFFPLLFHLTGGHIQGAINLHEEKHFQEFIQNLRKNRQQLQLTRLAPIRPVLVIVHCEFSQKRGPQMYVFLFSSHYFFVFCIILTIILPQSLLLSFLITKCLVRFRSLRTWDRNSHTKDYPFLEFPELYVLEGGYSQFFPLHKV